MTPAEALQLSDLWELKQALDMAYVLEAYGHEPALVEHGKLHYHSPFREDERPSFDVFEHQIKGRPGPEQRYGDFADPNLLQGDVFDLIQKFEPALSPVLVQDKARELLAAQIREGWNGVTTIAPTKVSLDLNNIEMLREIGLPVHRSPETWLATISERPGLQDLTPPVNRIFVDPRGDAITYLMTDRNGEVIGGRQRFPNGSKRAIPGTPNALMRMEDPTNKPVILTEGETDTWAAWGALSDEYEILGVPGVSNPPEKLLGDELVGREVTVMFDGDTAGADGAANWRAYLLAQGCTVRIAVLPEGRDVSSFTRDQIRELPAQARVLPPNTDRLYRRDDQFFWVVRPGRPDTEAISNWSFEPRSVLIGEDGVRSYEGVLLPSGRSVVLPHSALSSVANLSRWGEKYQARWFAGMPQVAHLAALLDHEAAFLPAGKITNQVGLQDGTFVFPDGYLGDTPVYYSPPVAAIPITTHELSLPDVECDVVEAFKRMMGTQDPAVVGPMLAWMAVAPLRTRFKQFPILSVSGASGSGKTTLTEELLRAFTGSNITTNLTSTTPHAVMAYIASSNGFPVWFDEYRPGASQGAKVALDQTLRDAYTGQSSAKGGQNRADLNQVTMLLTNAPIVVSGEDNFTETSHTDRMVLVRVLAREQGDLKSLRAVSTEGFARKYLQFLQTREFQFEDPPVLMSFDPTPVEGLRPRQGVNMAVLQLGWRLLASFLLAHDPEFDMPELDLSRVIEAGSLEGTTDPVMEAVRYCWENPDLPGPDAVWADDHYLYVSATNLLAKVQGIPGLVLPTSNATGITRLLRDVHEAESVVVRRYDWDASGKARQRRVCALPLDTLDWVDAPTEETHANHPEI